MLLGNLLGLLADFGSEELVLLVLDQDYLRYFFESSLFAHDLVFKELFVASTFLFGLDRDHHCFFLFLAAFQFSFSCLAQSSAQLNVFLLAKDDLWYLIL